MGKKMSVRTIALLGMLFALAVALSFLEGLVPPLTTVPGIKLGLSNLVVMVCLVCLSAREALFTAILKSLFVLLTRGSVAGLLSLAGGLASVLVMWLIFRLSKGGCSLLFLSMAGGVAHNMGQLVIACILISGLLAASLLPVMFAAGLIAGAITAGILMSLLPLIKRTGFFR